MQKRIPSDAGTNSHIIDGLESMEEAFVIYDKDGFLIACNRSFKKLYNYTDDQAKPGVHFRELGVIDIENGNVAIGTTDGEDYLSKKAEYRKKLQGSFDVLLKDGRWIRTTDRPLPDGGFVSVQFDITDQKQAETTLQDSQLKLTTLMRTSPAIIYSVDLQDEFNLTFVSPNILEILGYSTHECLTEPNFWENRLHPDEADTVKARLRRNIDASDTFTDEFRFRLSDGSYKWIEDRNNVFRDESGVATELVGTWVDITERKAMEDALKKATEEAEASNKAKSAFLANMSHEIRTPMNGVLGMADVLSRTELGSDQSRMVSAIVNSGYSLLRIIDDVLDYSKIEAGKLELDYVDMDIREALEGVAIMMAPVADSSNVRIMLAMEPNVPVKIHFDPVRLRQIVNNLLSNAIKFSRKADDQVKGRVRFSAKVLEGNRLQIQVSDDGVGMKEEAAATLFTPFEQAESSTTRRFGGTGLGLSIVKNLVDLMDGTIQVESELGLGSTFTVVLPFELLETSLPYERNVKVLGLYDSESDPTRLESDSRFWAPMDLSVFKNETALLDCSEAVDDSAIILLALGSMRENEPVLKHIKTKLPNAKFLCQTHDRSDQLGLVERNCYVISRFPTLPSEIRAAVETLSGKVTKSAGEPIEGSDASQDIRISARVLLVEDNAINRFVVESQLKKLGYEVGLANDGQEGFNKWSTGDFDIVLTDCHMPVMDGFELTAQIRDCEIEDSRKNTPVIALTANALKGEADRCIAAGMNDYLSKPVSLEDLDTTLQNWLRNNSTSL